LLRELLIWYFIFPIRFLDIDEFEFLNSRLKFLLF